MHLPVNGNAHNGGNGRGKEERNDRMQAMQPGNAEGNASARRADNPVREMKKPDGLVNNGKTEGDQCVN